MLNRIITLVILLHTSLSMYATTIPEKNMVIVTCSYNNAAYYEDNLKSILNQNYTNYRIVYVDDCSPDNTGQLVHDYLAKHDTHKRVTLIRNQVRCGAAENFYRTIHALDPEDIVVIVDGDDELNGNDALTVVNKEYQDPAVWMTYGNFLPKHITEPIPNGCSAQVPDYVIEQNCFRYIPSFTTSHLRTHYAWLYQQIKKEDLMVDGAFWKVAPDYANMIPMLEMAGRHSRFIKDILYIYNNQNPINESKVTEMHHMYYRSTAHFQTLPRYQPLAEAPCMDKVDLVIFSYDRAMQLHAYLESIHEHITHLNTIYVLYKTSNDNFTQAYDEVRTTFNRVVWIKQDNGTDDFKKLLLDICFKQSQAPYIMFGVDDIIVTEPVNLRECITSCTKTPHAYGFYLRLGKNIAQGPTLTKISHDISSFTFTKTDLNNPWNYPHAVDMVIYKKETLKMPFEVLPYRTPNDLEFHWSRSIPLPTTGAVGLCYNKSTMINAPLNVVNPQSHERHLNFATTTELNDLFLAGLKIDTSVVTHYNNTTVHEENFKPTFSVR